MLNIQTQYYINVSCNNKMYLIIPRLANGIFLTYSLKKELRKSIRNYWQRYRVINRASLFEVKALIQKRKR